MDSPIIQVGISVYQQPLHQLRHCVESCLQQSELPIHVVIRLDGPDAAAPDVVHWLENLVASHPNLELVRGERRVGTFGSYREIFATATAPFICQVDADDFLPPCALLTAHSFLANHESASFLYTQCIEVDANETPLGLGHRAQIPFDYLSHLTSFMTFHLRLVRRKFYDQVGGYSENYSFAGDYDLSLKLAEVGDVVFLDQPLYYYRLHSDSASQRQRDDVNQEVLLICRKAVERRRIADRYEVRCDADGIVELCDRGAVLNPHCEPEGGGLLGVAETVVRQVQDCVYVNENVFYISPVEAH